MKSAASRRVFDVFNESGQAPTDETLTAQLERLGSLAAPGPEAGRSRRSPSFSYRSNRSPEDSDALTQER